MLKHIVLWKLDANYTAVEKDKIKHEFRQRLTGLKDEIPELLTLEVFFNSELASSSNYDIILETIFNSIDDLNTYQHHPAHQNVVAYVKSLKQQRAAIDFMF